MKRFYLLLVQDWQFIKVAVVSEKFRERKDTMKIMIFGPVPKKLGGKTGGVATQVYSLYHELRERKHDVLIFAGIKHNEPKNYDEREINDIYFICYKDIFSAGLKNFLKGTVFALSYKIKFKLPFLRSLLYISLLGKKLEEFKPNIVHIHHAEERALFFYPFVKKFNNVITLHSFNSIRKNVPRASYNLRIVKFNLNKFRNFTAVSKAVREEAISLLCRNVIENKNIRVIYNGVDEGIFNFKDEAKENKVLLYVGNLNRRKRVKILIEASLIVLKTIKNFKLWIIGKGEEEQSLKDLCKREGIDNTVLFLGEVENNKLSYYYNKAFLLALASESEGFPMCIIESLVCGLPVVYSNVGGSKEAIVEGTNGFVVEKDTSREFAEKIIKAFNTKWNRETISLNAIKKFSWSKTARDFLQIYNEVSKEK